MNCEVIRNCEICLFILLEQHIDHASMIAQDRLPLNYCRYFLVDSGDIISQRDFTDLILFC